MNTKDIKPEQIDHSILDRVSEADVQSWLVARLHQIRQSELPQCTTLGLTCNFANWSRDPVYYISADVHGAGKCSGRTGSIAEALHELRKEILDNPAKQAAEKRSAAQRLLKEADELTAAALEMEAAVKVITQSHTAALL